MKIFFSIFSISLFFSNFAISQDEQPGSKPWLVAQGHSNNAVQSGRDSLLTLFDSTGCGLNFTVASHKLGMRLPLLNSPSVAQPAAFAISNIPIVAQIDKAYLWFVTAGNGIADTVTITNPVGLTLTFPMTIIDTSVDMCWGYAGTYAYRADVTSIINGNGNYIISGIPVSPPVSNNDADGATLMIIYNDPSVSYTGSLHINDGAIESTAYDTTQTMRGFNSCSNSSYANAFMIVADLQNIGCTFSMNNSSFFSVNDDWWNFISLSTNVMQGQTSCPFTVHSTGDCYCLAVTGLYTQTNCNNCIASIPENLQLENSLFITPNPNNGNFILNLSLARAQEISINVFDNLGQNVYASNENLAAGNISVDMKLSSLSEGIYFVEVKTANGIATKRLVIE